MVRGAWIQRKQLILPLGLYRHTPNNFKNHYNNNIPKLFWGFEASWTPLLGLFPAHSEWASSIPMYHSYARAQEWIDDLQIRKRTFLKQSFNSMLTHIQFKTHFVWITNLKVQQPNISHIYTLTSCGTWTGSAPYRFKAQERMSWACWLLLR